MHRTITAPQNNKEFFCVRHNPSCGRDPWWVAWDELQSEEFVQFTFLPPGLIAEARFIEAIWLLWQWEEGRTLLNAAAEHGVLIFALEKFEDAFAYYRPFTQNLVIGKRVIETSTWMVADVLAHELQHVSDHKTGTRMGNSAAECFARERAAYGVERRYLVWLSQRVGGLPSPSAVAGRLSNDDFNLYMNLYAIGTSPDLDAAVQSDYRKTCLR